MFIVVDVETDGPCPGLYSIVCFGAVIVEPTLSKTFYGEIKPISTRWIPESLAISGITREQHEKFDFAVNVMYNFEKWIKENTTKQPVFISDNNGFDFAFINYYFHAFLGRNPFGWSSRRIGDLYCGMQKDVYVKWKHLRTTKHTHNPVDDAMGNAEALLKMRAEGLNFKVK